MKKVLYIVALLLPLQSYAEVEKHVEVTKEYTPLVEQREKITLMPEMSVDGSITPDIDYSITPRSIENSYNIEPFAPVEINFWEYQPQSPLYVKLAGGAPATLVSDIYYTHLMESGYLLSYANYEGLYAKRRGIDAIKRSALEQHARLGSSYTQTGHKRNAYAELNYTLDEWSRYATNSLLDPTPLYQRVAASGGWGDSFVDLESLNLGIDAEAGYMWSDSEYKSTDLSLAGRVAHRTKKGQMHYHIGTEYIAASLNYQNIVAGAGARYSLSSPIFNLSLGVEIAMDYMSHLYNDTDVRVLPTASLDIKVKKSQLILFADLESELIHTNYASLIEENPYIAPALFGEENSTEYRLKGGAKGAVVGDKLGYSLYAHYRSCVDNIFWAFVADSQSNYYEIDSSTLHDLNFNLDLDYTPHTNFALRSNLLWRAMVETPKQSWESGLASFEYEFGARYTLNRFSVDAQLDILGKRETTIYISGAEAIGTIPTTVDLGVRVDYRLKRSINIFTELNNLLNDDLYRWYGYREYGVGFIAGLQVQF